MPDSVHPDQPSDSVVSAASDPDKEAAEFYADPANQRPAGPGRKRRPARLTSHVPVRFDRDVIEAVKIVADRDGMTVSSWIRRAVRDALSLRTRLAQGALIDGEAS